MGNENLQDATANIAGPYFVPGKGFTDAAAGMMEQALIEFILGDRWPIRAGSRRVQSEYVTSG